MLEWGRSAASGWVPPREVCLFPCCRGLAGVKFIKGTDFFNISYRVIPKSYISI
jgi:hypothetical protein